MSLNQNLAMNQDDQDPFLTSDEMIVLQMLGDKKLNSEVGLDQYYAQQQKGFMDKVSDDPFLLQGTPEETSSELQGVEHGIEGETLQTSGSGVSGGFAWAALLPLIPALAPLIKPTIETIVGLFRKKASGVLPPNYRGYGVNPPNIGGFDLASYMQTRVGPLKGREKKLFGLSGKAFWQEAKNIIKDEARALLPYLRQQGVNLTESGLRMIIDRIANQTIPKSFEKYADTPSKSKSGSGKGTSQLGSIIKPMVKYSIQKAMQKGVEPSYVKSLTSKVKDIDQYLDGETMETVGSGPRWERFKEIAKKVLAKIIPVTAPILKQVAQTIIDRLPALVESFMNQQGIQNPQIKNIVGQASKTVANVAVNEGLNQLQKIKATGKGSEAMKAKMASLRAKKGNGKKKVSKKKSSTKKEMFKVTLL
jgi:hypothetical protein